MKARRSDCEHYFLRRWVPSLFFVVLSCLMIGCMEEDPELFEMGAEQIQNADIKSFPLRPSRESNHAILSSETCDDVTLVNQPTVYQFEAKADINYEIYYHPSTQSCENMQLSLEAKTYIFDSQNRMVSNRSTNEQRTVKYIFKPVETGVYYYVIVPEFKDDIGGYSLTISEVKTAE